MVTASLDIGADTIVAALASVESTSCQLRNIKSIRSEVIEKGVVTDWGQFRKTVRTLLYEVVNDREVDLLNVALPRAALHVIEYRVSLSVRRKIVEEGDLAEAYRKCRTEYNQGKEEILEAFPVAYHIDGHACRQPLGKGGRQLDVTYLVYLADPDYLDRMVDSFSDFTFGNILFYPPEKAFQEAFAPLGAEDFAVVDLGGAGINVSLFKEGMLDCDTYLPLGMNTIDRDIEVAFNITPRQAFQLKCDSGHALRSCCKNRRVQIPDTDFVLESRDLSTVVQSRSEELMEGVAFQLQAWGFKDVNQVIYLTGGGSRLKDIDTLLQYYTGHRVTRAVMGRVSCQDRSLLEEPGCFIALGMLLCHRVEVEQEPKGIIDMFKNLFAKGK